MQIIQCPRRFEWKLVFAYGKGTIHCTQNEAQVLIFKQYFKVGTGVARLVPRVNAGILLDPAGSV